MKQGIPQISDCSPITTCLLMKLEKATFTTVFVEICKAPSRVDVAEFLCNCAVSPGKDASIRGEWNGGMVVQWGEGKNKFRSNHVLENTDSLRKRLCFFDAKYENQFPQDTQKNMENFHSTVSRSAVAKVLTLILVFQTSISLHLYVLEACYFAC